MTFTSSVARDVFHLIWSCVYKFISKGTIEEKIDTLLEEKKDLAEKIVTTTGESWITDLEGEKLKELLSLSK